MEISYSDDEAVVADPTRAMCYNRGCEYRRRALNPHGDLAFWIAFDDAMLSEVTGTSPEHPFRQLWAPLPRDAFVVARALAAEFGNGDSPDRLQVEDRAWWLLGRCVDSEHTTPKGTARQQRAVAEAEAFIAEHYRESVTLAQIAAAVHMSPFHLSRLFRRLTGTRLYWRLVELRLRESLQDVIDSPRTITEIAADFGFSSPSHFCHAFRVTFGSPPSHFRSRQATRGILERRKLTAQAALSPSLLS